MTEMSPIDLAELPSPELLDLLRAGSRILAERLLAPDALTNYDPAVATPADAVDWSGLTGAASDAPPEQVAAATEADVPSDKAVPSDDGDPPWSLPPVLSGLEELDRLVGAAQTAPADHAGRAFETETDRAKLLGIPVGKCAFRDAAELLRQRLATTRKECRERIRRAQSVTVPPPSVTGHQPQAPMPVLAGAFAAAEVDPASVDLIQQTIEAAGLAARRAGLDAQEVDALTQEGEELLTAQARTLDPDIIRRVCHRYAQWIQQMLLPEAGEPTPAQLAAHQGLAYQGKRSGVHQWLIGADDAQHEVLQTIVTAATNPRAADRGENVPTDEWAQAAPSSPPQDAPGEGAQAPEPTGLTEERTRPQRQLDGVISALKGALSMLSGNGLPSAGGVRPQVLVTIDHESLQDALHAVSRRASGPHPGANRRLTGIDGPDTTTLHQDELPLGDDQPTSSTRPRITARTTHRSRETLRSEAAFTGPVGPTMIRALACDAEILPVVLGAQGQVLDLGQAQRLFPVRLRRAIIARDGGCAAPGCTIVAPWCESHHIEYWERGGPTSVDNGVLLCSHHHHAVHAGAWSITLQDGRPWPIHGAVARSQSRD